jgi:hypothetical protein
MKTVYQEEIESINKFRYSLIKKQNEGTTTSAEIQKIDDLAKEIQQYIKFYFEYLPFDFTMEQLANLGQCPNLINDDNGHWAVSSDGFQNVPKGEEPGDIETHFYIEAHEWRNSPKEALKYYLEQE